MADGGEIATKKRERLSGGRLVIEHLRGEDHVHVCDIDAVLFGQKMYTSLFGGTYAVDPEVIEDFARCAATEAVDEVEWHRKLFVDNCREDCEAIRRKIRSLHE